MSTPRLIVVGPLPPPYHGVTVSTSLVLANPITRERFAVEHLDTSDHRPMRNLGRWDARNAMLAVSAFARLARLQRGGPGVVYLPVSQSAAGFLRDSLLVHLAAARGWKVAAHLRGSDFRTFYSRSSPPLRRWIRLALGRVDSVAVTGASLRWVFEGLVPADRLEVVPNGTPEPSSNGVARDPETVLFLGNLRRRKGVLKAVEAAGLVLRERPSARFLFVGEWEGPELEKELRSRAAGMGGTIEFRPAVSGRDKDRLLASSSILLFPPVEPEGHPRVVLEGLAAGLPVVTTDRGAIRETVVGGESGFVLDEPDPVQLAERLLTLLGDSALRERMGRAARARHRSLFSQEQADHRLAEWLSKVAESP